MYPTLQNVCAKMSVYIKRQIEIGKPFNGKELASKFTIDSVAGCIYGIDSESFTSDKCELLEYGSKVLTPSTKVLIYFTAITMFPFLKRIWKVPFCDRKVEDYFISLLNDTVRMREESNVERNDYLNFVIELKKKKNITDVEMAAHVMSFIVDGFDTSSGVIANAFYALAMDKRVQLKLREEIEYTIGRDGGITFENIQEMSYLDQVVNGKFRFSFV